MAAPDSRVMQDLRAAEQALANMRVSMHQFYVACQFENWEAAEISRDAAVAYLESALDAHHRAARRVETGRK